MSWYAMDDEGTVLDAAQHKLIGGPELGTTHPSHRKAC